MVFFIKTTFSIVIYYCDEVMKHESREVSNSYS